MKVNILGTQYNIAVKRYDEDEVFEKDSCSGYCNGWTKEIVLCDMTTLPCWKHEPPNVSAVAQKTSLRHEIVHAFLNESGLQDNTACYDGGWAQFEEMVDWIAIQGPKIYKAWGEAGAI